MQIGEGEEEDTDGGSDARDDRKESLFRHACKKCPVKNDLSWQAKEGLVSSGTAQDRTCSEPFPFHAQWSLSISWKLHHNKAPHSGELSSNYAQYDPAAECIHPTTHELLDMVWPDLCRCPAGAGCTPGAFSW
ncbi:hypothetical protein CIHG_05656 [Coccidioides immitis H538.4]|uniref:Uncharacterized protein n=3 Tax=Coccidioides immitis TaxID=5501 RepID=A0A0J8R1Y7_COCIT|nr:hypothetical protein CIRG_08441 [Coccidioides immitis RMSCC 2394]KMU78751.1 hypothetical protein CISG_01791 [Coccidioides immitis RMSCC 3703]KMU87889.1 hypothetical protein CIHG_05656 [Coccidioides immitis H538.4]